MLNETMPGVDVTLKGEKANISMPIQKYSVEARTVSGFATLDNLDEQGDIVTSEAAYKAFTRFRGNIREQHQPIAVGKLLSFSQEMYYDVETEKFYNGIYVSAYISKGAQDTWEKVLDGTLGAFSIGGVVKDVERLKNDENGEIVHIIKDMDIFELSLVDNPANSLANVVSIQKLKDGTIKLSGILADTKTETIFWCDDCSIASTEVSVSKNCRSCSGEMINVGWLSENENYSSSVEKAVKDYKNSQAIYKSGNNPTEPSEVHADTKNEGVTTMDKTTETEVVEESAQTDANADANANADAEVEVAEKEIEDETSENKEVVSEESVDTEEEVEETETQIDIEAITARVLEDIKTFLTEEARPKVEKKSIDSETTENKMESLIKSVVEKIDVLNKSITSVERRIESLENSGAIRKSGEADAAPAEKTVKKSLWDGHFLGVSHISRD